MTRPRRIVIVGGVAGGMSAAARLRRVDEFAEITVVERSDHVSYANCVLPYFVGGVIPERDDLLLQTPQSLKERFELDVRVRHEARSIDRARFDRLPGMVFWFQRAAEAAQQTADIALFEDVAEIFVTVDAGLDRWNQKPRSDKWLADLTGEHAQIVARLVLESPKVSAYYATSRPPDRMHPDLAGVLVQAAGTA